MGLTRPTIYNLQTNIEVFNDSITVLNAAASSPSTDVGFLFNRAHGLVPNAAAYWSESLQSFMYALTASNGTPNTNIAVQSYANVTVGNLLLVQGSILGVIGNLQIGNLTANSGVYSNTASITGNITSGNVLASGFFYANGSPFVSSTYGNTQMLANLASANNPITIGSNLNLVTQLTSTTATSNTGTLSVGGNINYGPDYGLMASFVANIPNYAYVAVQNLNTGGNASTRFTAYNNTGTSYLEMGINSSNFNAVSSGYVNNSANQPNASYTYGFGGDMVVGTWGNNGLHFITNAQTNVGDSMFIAGNGNVYISGNLTVSGNTAFTYTTTNFVAESANVIQTAYLSGNVSTNSGTITLTNNLIPNGTGVTLGSSGSPFGSIYGTLQTAAQTNITSVGTLTGLTVAGTGTVTTVNANTVNAATIGNASATLTGATGTFTTSVTTPTVTATTVNAATIGNASAALSGATGTFTGTVIAQTVNAATIGNTGASITGATLNTSGTATVNALTSNGAVLGTTATFNTVNAATIGNSGAVLYGTLNSSSASQPNITTLAGVTSIGASGVTTTAAGNFTITGSLTVNGTTTTINNTTVETTEYVQNIYATSVNSVTIGNSGAVLYGTLNSASASQTNITAVGTLTGLTTGTILPSANVTQNLGSTSAYWNNIYGITFVGTSTTAKYADLAENYVADAKYSPGTVVVFGGEKEITTTTISHDTKVAGVISTNPAYLMNGAIDGLPVALTGRVPCLVKGPVTKGQVLVTSTTPGVAQAIDNTMFLPGCILGKSLESININTIATIEVVVGRF